MINNFKKYIKNTINKLKEENLILRKELNEILNINKTRLFDEFLEEFMNTNQKDILIKKQEKYWNIFFNNKHYILIIEPTKFGSMVIKPFYVGLYIYNYIGEYNYLRSDLIVPIYIKKGRFNKQARNFKLLIKVLYNIDKLRDNNQCLQIEIDDIKKTYTEIKNLGDKL